MTEPPPSGPGRWLSSLLPTGGKRRTWIDDLSKPDAQVRARAALGLGELKHPEAIEPLVRALDDPDEVVRTRAGWALAEIGPAAGPLVARALVGAPPLKRASLFGVLGRIASGDGTAEAVAALSDPDAGVRVAAAEALRRITEPEHGLQPEGDVAPSVPAGDRAAGDLILGLRGYEPEVRRASAQALGEMRHRPAASALLAVMKDRDENADIRGAAAVALGRIGEERAVQPLLEMLDDEELEDFARPALCEMGRGLADLLQSLEAPSDAKRGGGSKSRARLIHALGVLGDPGAVGILLRSAVDPVASVRKATAEALGAIAFRVAQGKSDAPAEWARLRTASAEVLDQMLSDADAAVRLAALRAHFQPPSFGRLVVLAAEADPEMREKAVRTIGDLDGPEVFDALAVALLDADDFVRVAALDGLGRIDTPRAVSLIIASLGDPAVRVRMSAAYALAPRDPWKSKHLPVVRAALLRALGDEALEVRHSSAVVLRRLRDTGAVDALIRALGDPEPYVRNAVAHALGGLGQKRAIPALVALESDPTPSVRSTAAMAAGALGHRKR